jgi:hypothetical protein
MPQLTNRDHVASDQRLVSGLLEKTNNSPSIANKAKLEISENTIRLVIAVTNVSFVDTERFTANSTNNERMTAKMV